MTFHHDVLPHYRPRIAQPWTETSLTWFLSSILSQWWNIWTNTGLIVSVTPRPGPPCRRESTSVMVWIWNVPAGSCVECLVPSWWCYFGRWLKLEEVGPSWKKWITKGCAFEGCTWPPSSLSLSAACPPWVKEPTPLHAPTAMMFCSIAWNQATMAELSETVSQRKSFLP
jgi:hypothetical protein